MIPIGQGFGRIVQLAYLVEDIDVAMEQWLRQAGLGPWTCFRNIRLDTRFDGRDFTLNIHEALAYIGDLQIQLVQSLDPPETVTPYRDYVRAARWGVHHVAFFADDIEAAVERARKQGFERTCAMRDKAGYRYYYLQSSKLPDVWVEFLESYPGLHAIFDEGIAAAADWDGRDPIRNFEYEDL
jgi:catechol 2,3-dioxygenase-like lactoylglutathione lyase family enzyme